MKYFAVAVLFACLAVGSAIYEPEAEREYKIFEHPRIFLHHHALIYHKILHKFFGKKFAKVESPAPEAEMPSPEASPEVAPVPSPSPRRTRSPAPKSCEDIPPTPEYTCAEEKANGRCGSRAFRRNGFCQKTCGTCPEAAVETKAGGVVSADVQDCSSVIERLEATPELSILKTALTAAGLLETFNEDFVGTVFAPVNSGFERLLESLPDVTLEDLVENKELLTQILTLHVLPEVVTSDQIEDGAEVSTLNEAQNLTTLKDLDGVQVLATGADEAANVLVADVISCNAIVHPIDAVLIPADLL